MVTKHHLAKLARRGKSHEGETTFSNKREEGIEGVRGLSMVEEKNQESRSKHLEELRGAMQLSRTDVVWPGLMSAHILSSEVLDVDSR